MKQLLALALLLANSLLMAQYIDYIPFTTLAWPPFVNVDEQNHDTLTDGVFIDVINEIAKRMDADADISLQDSWPHCYESVVNGYVWAAFPYTKTSVREAEVLFTDEVVTTEFRLLYYDNNPIPHYTGPDQLKGYKIGAVKGHFYEDFLAEHNFEPVYTSSEIFAINKLVQGEIDVLPINQKIAQELINKFFANKASNFGWLQGNFCRNSLHLAVSRHYPQSHKILDSFNQVLRDMHQDGTLAAIIKKYGLEPR